MVNDALLPTEADVQFYRDNGYWISDKVVSDDLLARMREHMDLVFDGKYETGKTPLPYWTPGVDDPMVVRKVDYAHWADRTIAELALDETIGGIAARLAETPTIRLWHDQLLYKPGDSTAKGNVGWHQDYFYWQCAKPADMLTAWVALVDVDETNGCMQFVPGSHKWGLLDEDLDFFDNDRDAQLSRIKDPSGGSANVVNVRLKAGQVSFHHCLLLHGSGPNLTDSPRRSLVIHMMPGHTRRQMGTKDDAHSNCKYFKGNDGDLWTGEEFPVIYQG